MTVRHKMLYFWLKLACSSMERAMRYSAELMSVRIDDDLLLAWRILYKAVFGKPAPKPKGIRSSPAVDAAIASWENR